MGKLLQIFLLVIILDFPVFALYQTPVAGIIYNKDYLVSVRLKDKDQTIETQKSRYTRTGNMLVEYMNTQSLVSSQASQTITYYNVNNNQLTALAQASITSKEGATTLTTQVNFDWNKMQAIFTSNGSSKYISLTKKTILSRSSTFYFQGLIANKVTDDDFVMIIPVGTTYNMHAHITYSPDVIRVDMKPSMGFISMVLPNMAFYFNSSPPYNFIQYQGPQEGPTSPNVIQEVVK